MSVIDSNVYVFYFKIYYFERIIEFEVYVKKEINIVCVFEIDIFIFFEIYRYMYLKFVV